MAKTDTFTYTVAQQCLAKSFIIKAKLADAADLKSRVSKETYRFNSGPGHHSRTFCIWGLLIGVTSSSPDVRPAYARNYAHSLVIAVFLLLLIE